MKKINLLLSGALTLALLNPTQVISAQTSGKVKDLPLAQKTKILQSLVSNMKLRDMTENIKFGMTSKVDPKYSKLIESASKFDFSTEMKYDVDKDVCDFNKMNLGLTLNSPSSKLFNAYFGGSGWMEVQNLKDLGNFNVYFNVSKLTLPPAALTSPELKDIAPAISMFTNKPFYISMKDILKLDPDTQKELQPTFDAYKKVMGNLGTMDTTKLQNAYKPLLDSATYSVNGNKMNVNFVINDYNKFSQDLVAGLNLQQLLGGTELAKGLDLSSLAEELGGTELDANLPTLSQSNVKSVKYSVELTNNVMTGIKASFVVSENETVKVNSVSKQIPVEYQANLECTMNYNSVNITPKKPGQATNLMDLAGMLQ